MRIELTRGKFANIDEQDAALIAPFTWVAVPAHTKHFERWYASAWNKGVGGTLYMHRLIAGAKKGQCVDHINHDGLDNRRGNLRLATLRENAANSRIAAVTRSGFRGVYPSNPPGKWVARIGSEGQILARCKTPEEAARAYDTAAALRYGNFAILNFPGA